MRRRTFVASGLGLMTGAASEVLSGLISTALAQPAPAPAPPAPQGKWIRLAPLPQGTGELLAVAVNGKLYASQGLLPGFKPAGLVYEYDPASDAWAQKKPMPIRSTTPPSPRRTGRCTSSEDSIFLRRGLPAGIRSMTSGSTIQ